MKKLFIIAIVLMLGAPTWAQSTHDYIEIERSVLNSQRKAVVADAMVLTDEEATVFWPLYNEYNDEVYKVKTKRVQIISDYAENFDNLTDVKADELMNSSLKVQDELMRLKKAYYKKFKKILSPSKVVRYFQIENKIDAMINAEIALEIPLVESLNKSQK